MTFYLPLFHRSKYFIKNAGGLEYTPSRLTEDAEIQKAFEIANTANMSREELDVQWKQHDFILCQKGSIEFALKQGREEGREEGKKEGIEQGMEQGRKEKAIEMAKSLLILKIDIEKILAVTGLTVDEVEKIK